EEEAVYSSTKPRGGKGAAASKPKATISVSYRYYANVAIGLCEGPIAFVRRVWADGRLLDLTNVAMRVHQGSEDQPADPLIAAKQGAANAPAYRGLAYVVFERLPLEDYGNRLPQFTFEVVRPVHGLCRRIRAVNLIPGAGEYVYEPAWVMTLGGIGSSGLPNRTQLTHATNWYASIDALQALCPNLEYVALVVAWFGNDLRAGACTVRPLTEPGATDAIPFGWSVSGLSRPAAGTVSQVDGKAAYGGTPSDGSVLRAIRDLKARGLKVTLYPFMMMDVPPGNALTNPATGLAGQPPYPWRGRITCYPAPGKSGSVEGTAAADAQVQAFFGTCGAGHFTVGPDIVVYSGPAEWTLRRLVLHVAALGKAAGGVEALILCSEFAALTRVRGTASVNPAVAGLKALAAEVRALLGASTKLTYGADWTEYGAESRSGGQDVAFPLDPLWSDPNIDSVAIDWYPPMTDWRDGLSHIDAGLYDGPHDRRMFAERIGSGEAYDWYYSSDAARTAQIRTPITDGGYGKPWVFRQKDILSWWSNWHYPRSGGIEAGAPTGWIPGSKPIWLLELGCPAVDRGGNGPNVFPDPKSSENAIPHFSRGSRDDLAQACVIRAVLDRFNPDAPGFGAAANPVAALYGGRMVDPSRIYLWCWDARPFPAFPDHGEVWADAGAFETGHWLNGRIEGAPLDDLLAALLADRGIPPAAAIDADGFVDGYVIDRPMSARAAIEPLAEAFAFEALFSSGTLRFIRRSGRAASTLLPDDLAVTEAMDRPAKARTQASELPSALTFGFVESNAAYRQGSVRVSVPALRTREVTAALAAGLSREQALHRAEVMLNETLTARDSIILQLPPSRLDLEPGDTVMIDGLSYRIRRITDGATRRAEGVATSRTLYLGAPRPGRQQQLPPPPLSGPPTVVAMDLAFTDGDLPVLQRLAVSADPWPGAYTVWRSVDGASFEPVQRVSTRATIGLTATVLPPGPLWRLDAGGSVEVTLANGALQSVSTAAMLGGANMIAIELAGQGWEILGFTTADLLAQNRWRLSGLLRGLAGSEPLAASLKPAGSRAVILDGSIVDLASGLEWLGREAIYRVAPEGRDHADPAAASFRATAGLTALLPLSPVRPTAVRGPSGVTISWIRRARSGGDNWDQADVPLGEAREGYQVEILSGAAVKRRYECAQAMLLYPTADEAADFGAAQTTLGLRIRQISESAGAGFECLESVPVL
ncbi:MAG: glycoside hydrolase/phage tail family protein, partial [Methylocystis sp.]|nr:glycoside hydrolase/phage tail family protein [Methylocystis sp.]